MSIKPSKLKKLRGVSTELIIAVTAAVIMFVLLAVTYPTFENPTALFGIVCLVLYALIVSGAIMLVRLQKRGGIDEEKMSPYLGDIMTDAMMNISVPSAICAERGVVIWNNGAFTELAGELGVGGKLRGKPLSGILPVKFSEITDGGGNGVFVRTPAHSFQVKNYRFRVNGQLFHMVSVYDRTEAEELRRELSAERTLVAHIQIDNLNEISQYEHGEFRDAARDVDAILKAWSDSVDGILREYERNKYIFFFKERYIDEFTLRRFDVLDKVRAIRVGEGFTPVTVSIGISKDEGTLWECERASFAALDTALQRGGDQVVLRSEGGTEFFGGRTKATQKRTKVRSRVIAGELVRHICNAGNVIIMGHRYPDFDSIGACVGMARLAIHCGVPVNIVTDVNDKNIADAVRHVSSLSGYETMFADEVTAMDMLRSDTLVIVCDVNNFTHFAAPDIAKLAQKLVIVDHHIKTADPPREALLSYIEPSASSTCELISDMLEQLYQSGGVVSAEADVMYAGILLDTKQLSRSTSPRTFSAAMYLQSCGANPEVASDFFRAGLDDFTREAKFESNVTIYRGAIAIACSTGTGSAADRVAASKAADKLLTVKDVSAAFAVVSIDGSVHISARSTGVINVQLILERLGGGGHFDSAGAQIKNAELDAALKNLKTAIDEYLEEAKINL